MSYINIISKCFIFFIYYSILVCLLGLFIYICAGGFNSGLIAKGASFAAADLVIFILWHSIEHDHDKFDSIMKKMKQNKFDLYKV